MTTSTLPYTFVDTDGNTALSITGAGFTQLAQLAVTNSLIASGAASIGSAKFVNVVGTALNSAQTSGFFAGTQLGTMGLLQITVAGTVVTVPYFKGGGFV